MVTAGQRQNGVTDRSNRTEWQNGARLLRQGGGGDRRSARFPEENRHGAVRSRTSASACGNGRSEDPSSRVPGMLREPRRAWRAPAGDLSASATPRKGKDHGAHARAAERRRRPRPRVAVEPRTLSAQRPATRGRSCEYHCGGAGPRRGHAAPAAAPTGLPPRAPSPAPVRLRGVARWHPRARSRTRAGQSLVASTSEK
jgi:hypothetical protein